MRYFYENLFPLLVLLFIIVWFCFEGKLRPPIGTYMSILAFLAVLVTIWPPEHPWVKAIWLIIFACLLIFEIRALYKDKSEYIEQQKNLNESFKNIGENFEKTSKHLEEILKEAKESREEERNQFSHLLERQEALFIRQERIAKETLAKVKEREGSLTPDNLPNPISRCKIPENQLAVYFAGGAAWNLHFPYILLKFRQQDVITLDKDQNGGFFISTKIFDDRGDLVVNIERNKFIATYAASYLEKTAHSLVVYNRRGDRVLSVRFLNPSAFEILGSFYFNNVQINIDENQIQILPSGTILNAPCSGSGAGVFMGIG